MFPTKPTPVSMRVCTRARPLHARCRFRHARGGSCCQQQEQMQLADWVGVPPAAHRRGESWRRPTASWGGPASRGDFGKEPDFGCHTAGSARTFRIHDGLWALSCSDTPG